MLKFPEKGMRVKVLANPSSKYGWVGEVMGYDTSTGDVAVKFDNGGIHPFKRGELRFVGRGGK